MLETTVARLVRDASQNKYYVIFPDIVFDKVSCSQTLTANEKLVWLNIARKIIREPNLSLVVTYQQIAEMVGLKLDSAYRVVKVLKEKGFLQSSTDMTKQRVTYTLGLPDEIVCAIENAPSRSKGETREQIQRGDFPQRSDLSFVPPKLISIDCGNGLEANKAEIPDLSDIDPSSIGSISDSPPDQNPILLININNINKKHDHEKQFSATDKAHSPEGKNASALVRDFENFHKEYEHLQPVERMRRVSSHFSQEQMKVILDAITEKQKYLDSIQNQNESIASNLASCIYKHKPIPEQQTQPSLDHCIKFDFGGESFYIEESVKEMILTQLPELFQNNKIKGEAADRPIKTLMTEILFYVTKSGNRKLTSDEQLKRFYIARKICLKGDWERPKGMTCQGSVQREERWRAAKLSEIRAAKLHLHAVASL